MNLKPMMTSQELVDKMKNEKGIKFAYMSEEDAIIFLSERNNYFRIASYRKNYDKHISGVNAGKYIDLDFAYLSELATIDMHLRLIIINMCLDIEHCLKVKLLSAITANSAEDGYDIVKVFLIKNPFVLRDIYHKRKSTYVEELIRYYFNFNEISDNAVKSLRNACAHNNCIIYNLRKSGTHPTREVTQFVSNIKNISNEERRSKLKIRPVFEITALICLYDKVAFDTVKSHRFQELSNLVNVRMVRNKDYFKNHQMICSVYNFLKKIVDFLA